MYRLQGEERSLELTSKDSAGRRASPIIIAHVDHGIREESGDDARFVEGLAAAYGLPFVSAQLDLGSAASEEMARQARYSFLFAKAKELDAVIATAHHLDDMVGSIAINILRGTGWRGLAVLNRPGVSRPLLGWTKRQVYDYALINRLEWVEDITNSSDKYMRNRLRRYVVNLPLDTKIELARLRDRQRILVRDIDRTVERLLGRHRGSRHFFTMIDETIAVELLRSHIAAETGVRPVADQAIRALYAIKTGRVGSRHDVGEGVYVSLSKQTYIVGRHLK